MSKEALKNIPEPESVEKPIVSDDVKSQLPEPKGWKILVAQQLKMKRYLIFADMF